MGGHLTDAAGENVIMAIAIPFPKLVIAGKPLLLGTRFDADIDFTIRKESARAPTGSMGQCQIGLEMTSS